MTGRSAAEWSVIQRDPIVIQLRRRREELGLSQVAVAGRVLDLTAPASPEECD